MIKKTLFFLLVFIGIKTYGQKEVLEIPNRYSSTFYNNKESLAISNKQTGELLIFIEDIDISKAYLLDNNLIIKAELSLKSLPSSFKEFIGHQINDDGTYSILYTNSSKKKFGELNIDFSKEGYTINEIDFKFKKEAYVESISHKRKFYIISATKNSNDINFYRLENKKILKEKTLSFDFLERREKGTSGNTFTRKAYNIFVSKGFSSTGSLVKMDIKTPNAIETTSKPNKLYVINDTFVFTVDYFSDNTEIISVSPENFKLEHISIPKPEVRQQFLNHNSYIYDDKIVKCVNEIYY